MKHPVSQLLKSKTNKLFNVSPKDSVADAIHAMNEANIGAVLVMEGDTLKGVFTERDVLRKACFRTLDDMKNTLVEHMMTEKPITGTPQTTVEEVMQIFTEKRFRHLPILDGDKLVGVVSSGDVTKWIIREQQSELDQLADYISGDHIGLKPHEE